MAKASSLAADPAAPSEEVLDEASSRETNPFQALVRRAVEDAVRRSPTYREDALVPGGGE